MFIEEPIADLKQQETDRGDRKRRDTDSQYGQRRAAEPDALDATYLGCHPKDQGVNHIGENNGNKEHGDYDDSFHLTFQPENLALSGFTRLRRT
jgi:hypothetical protein